MISPDIRYVSTPQQLAPLLEAVASSDSVAFDTEFIGESSYEPILCLVQIAAGGEIWVLDPLALPDLRDFWQLLTEPHREVITVAAREEIRFCLRYAGRAPERLVDLQIAAGLVGYAYPLSHTNLLRSVLDVNVSGRETFTDWKRRPLTDQQVEYSADDVRHLHALRDRLMGRAREMGREEWVSGECRRLAERVRTAESEERWWKVSGSGSLRRRDLAVLRELWRWRDAEAKGANMPPRRVLKDELLVEITKRKPVSVADLYALRGLDKGAIRGAGPAVIEAVQRAMQIPDAELPKLLRRSDPPQLPVLSQLLSVAANALAAEHQVDPALLATAADLQELARWRLGASTEDGEPPVLSGWRGEILGRPLLDILEGKRIVRVGALKRPNPLVFEER